MPNGSTGTGISIIFYLVLALLMPFVFLFRLARKTSIFRYRFVVRHFLYAALIAATIVVGIAYLTSITGLKGKGEWHKMMLLGGKTTALLLITWTLAPLWVKLWLKLFKKTAPAPPKPFESFIKPNTGFTIDGVISLQRWNELSK